MNGYLLTKKIAGGLRIKEVHADDEMGHPHRTEVQLPVRRWSLAGWITLGPRYYYDRNLISGDQLRQCKYYSRFSIPQNPLGNGLQGHLCPGDGFLGVNGMFGSLRRRFNAGCDIRHSLSRRRYNSTAPAYNTEYPFLRYTSDAWRRGRASSAPTN